MAIFSNIKRLAVHAVFVTILCVVTHYTVYYRFTPNYVPGVFSEAGFRAMYQESVFRHRILGIKLQLYLYEKIKSLGFEVRENKLYSKRLAALDPDADPLFYATYFIINTASCVITALLLLLVYSHDRLYKLERHEMLLSVTMVILLIALTQFVVTPYDNLGYAALVLCFCLFIIHERKSGTLTYLLLSASLFMATLIRESSVLVLSTMAAVHIWHNGFNLKLLIRKLWLPCLAFAAAYVGVRYYHPGSADVIKQVTLFKNILYFESTSNIIGIAFALAVFYILWVYASSGNKHLFKIFLLMSAPYVVAIFAAGLLIEFRLWVPVIICALLLCRLEKDKLYGANVKKSVAADFSVTKTVSY